MYHGLSYASVYKVVELSATLTSCNIEEMYTLMHYQLSAYFSEMGQAA